MMGAAGHTVLVSGATLALCFAGIAALPLGMLRTMGIGAGSVAALAVVVNLTLTPTLLLSFPRFFSDFACGGCSCFCRSTTSDSGGSGGAANSSSTAPLVLNGPADAALDVTVSSPPTSSPAPASAVATAADARPKASVSPMRARSAQCWLRVAACTQRFALCTIMIVILAALPFILKLPSLRSTADFALLTPRGAPCSLAYDEVIRDFGSGADAPYQLLLTPRAANDSVASQTFFDDVNALVHYLSTRNASRGGALVELHWLLSVTGTVLPAWMTGGHERWHPISFSNYTWLEGRTHIAGKPTELGAELRMLWDQQVSSVDFNRTMMLTVRLPFDPFSDRGASWLRDMRAAMVDAASDPECLCQSSLDVRAIQLAGGASGILDAISSVYAAMPLVIATTFVAAFAVILLAFRSLLVPLRAVLSIALTTACAGRNTFERIRSACARACALRPRPCPSEVAPRVIKTLLCVPASGMFAAGCTALPSGSIRKVGSLGLVYPPYCRHRAASLGSCLSSRFRSLLASASTMMCSSSHECSNCGSRARRTLEPSPLAWCVRAMSSLLRGS